MEHDVAESEEIKKGDCCAPLAFSYKKIHDFLVATQFLVLISVAMST